MVDLGRFASWQFRLLANGGEEVLRASTLREMHRVHWTDPDWKTTWGLGFMVSRVGDETMVSHGGGCPGYSTSFAMLPKHKLAVIALVSASGIEPFRIAANAFKMLGPALEKAANGPAVDTPDLSEYAGLWSRSKVTASSEYGITTKVGPKHGSSSATALGPWLPSPGTDFG